jgi:hypothetical protein
MDIELESEPIIISHNETKRSKAKRIKTKQKDDGNYKHKKTLEEGQNMELCIPHNFFVHDPMQRQVSYKDDIFSNKIVENRAYEQYFWSADVVRRIRDALIFTDEGSCCCFTTPSLTEGFLEQGRDEPLLDIDIRFNYLKLFQQFDIKNPHEPGGMENFKVIIIDPPFFNISIMELFHATNVITNNNFNTNIIIGFLKRYEYALLETFKPYGISETSMNLEYAHIKPNKWPNFTLYSNIDLPGIKRIPSKHNYKCRKLAV